MPADHGEIEIYSADQLAELLGVNRKTIYEAAKSGDIPHRRLGRRLIFEKGSVLAWLRQSSAISEARTK
ncbi:Helix-turn-helix domain protein [Enhygromyxa salina]|uniref:Helix-turn-helix domain protein n=2 Tax=Enhygromyxa salina TaxID=215803 RepID=A0A2S9YA85_9BACT|nr:Helix-turn-helix domain protein [Enhygromyxa salina]